MVKFALLIGVSEYEPGINLLPAAAKDVEAMQQVLQHPEMGGFDEVKPLLNPERQTMEEAIETIFKGRQKDDLVLLFFSGHGIKDESGNLYFATRITRKDIKGELVKATAVPARFVHDIMRNSRSKHQVVILDCCFSGAFAEGLSAKDDGFVDVKNQLGGEGRAVLTSSTSTQYSFEQPGADTSTYTRYIVEGLKTGAADRDQDGWISVDELHEYAARKVQEAAPAMKPEIYAIKEGYKIKLAKAPIGDPKLIYRREVEYWVKGGDGEISFTGRTTLDEKRNTLGLSSQETAAIEAQVLEPIKVYKQKLQRYEQALRTEIEHGFPLSQRTRADLTRLQQVLGLTDQHIALVEAPIIAEQQPSRPKNPPPHPSRNKIFLLFIGAVSCFGAGFLFHEKLNLNRPDTNAPQPITQSPKSPPDSCIHKRMSCGQKSFLTESEDKNSEFKDAKYKGLAAFSEGNYQQAAKDFENAHKTYKNAPETLIYLRNAQIGNRPSYKIAVVVPMDENPNLALEILRGVAQAQEEINQTGGIQNIPLKVVIANDSEQLNDSEQAKDTEDIAQALVNDGDVLGVVGHISSTATLLSEKIYTGKLVAISPTSTAVDIRSTSGSKPYVFRTVPSDQVAANALAKYMLNKLKKTKAVVFFNSKNPYSKSLSNEFREELKKAGGQVVNYQNGQFNDSFDLHNKSFNASNSLKQAAGAEVLMLVPDRDTLDKALQVVGENRGKLGLLAGDYVYGTNLLKVGGKAAKGMVLAVPWAIESNQNQMFVKTSETVWGKVNVNWRTALSYDATLALIEGLKQKPTRLGVQQALSSNFFSTGASGKIEFSRSGDRKGGVQLMTLVKVQQKSGSNDYEFVPLPNSK